MDGSIYIGKIAAAKRAEKKKENKLKAKAARNEVGDEDKFMYSASINRNMDYEPKFNNQEINPPHSLILDEEENLPSPRESYLNPNPIIENDSELTSDPRDSFSTVSNNSPRESRIQNESLSKTRTCKSGKLGCVTMGGKYKTKRRKRRKTKRRTNKKSKKTKIHNKK